MPVFRVNVPGGTDLIDTDGPGGAAFDFLADAPVGTVIFWRAALNAHVNLPNGATPKWAVIAVDEALVGSKADGTDQDTIGGTESLAAEGAHAGAAVANHVVTQPGGHSNHVVTQPGAHVFTQPDGHAAHVVTQPVDHSGTRKGGTTNPATIADGTLTHVVGVDAHSAHAGGAVDAHAGAAVDAHSAHAGGAVDAHGVTQPNTHATKKFHRLYCLEKTVA